MSTRGIVGLTGAATATVATIFNRAGEVAAQIADTAVLEKALTTTALMRFRADIAAAPFLVLDGNLHPDTLQVLGLKVATCCLLDACTRCGDVSTPHIMGQHTGCGATCFFAQGACVV